MLEHRLKAKEEKIQQKMQELFDKKYKKYNLPPSTLVSGLTNATSNENLS